MRRRARRAEVGMQMLGGVFAGGFVLLVSTGFFGGAYALLEAQRPDLLDLLLFILFFIWQLAPALFEGFSPGLNFREVARYPISLRLYFLLNTVYGLSDPIALACCFWLFCVWLAIRIRQPEWAIPAAFAFLLFAIFNLLCNRVITGLLERFQSTRKGRERIVLITLVIMLMPQLLQFATGNWTRMPAMNLPPWLLTLVPFVRGSLPSGMAARAFLFSGREELLALTGLVIYSAIALLLLWQQLRGVYLGEIYSESFVARTELEIQPGWRFPGLDEVTSAIVEKELRYLRQNSRLLLQLVYPPVIFLLMAFNSPMRRMSFGAKPSGLIAGMGGFMLLALPNFAYNTFGLDKEAFGRWLLSPLPLRKVLIAKNVAQGSLFAILFLVIAIVFAFVSHTGFLQEATVTLAFFAVLIIQFAAGNLVSVYWPRRVDLTQMNSRMASQAAGFASLLVLLSIGALAGLTMLLAWYWQLSWLPLLVAIVSLAASLPLYSFLLNRTVTYTYEHLDEITSNLGA